MLHYNICNHWNWNGHDYLATHCTRSVAPLRTPTLLFERTVTAGCMVHATGGARWGGYAPLENNVGTLRYDGSPNQVYSDVAVEVEDDRKEEEGHGVRVAERRPEAERLVGVILTQ